jgi:signal transduction histidine kinase
MRIRWTPIDTVCKTVVETAGNDVACWIEHEDGSVAAGSRRDSVDDLARESLRYGSEDVGYACVSGPDHSRWISLLVACVGRELAHQVTVSDMADATARLWKHTNALIRMAASTKISLEPAVILDKVLSTLKRSTSLGEGLGLVQLPNQDTLALFRGEETREVETEITAAFFDVGDDVRIVTRDDEATELRDACTRLLGEETPVAVVRLSTEAEQLGFLIVPIDDGESVTSEELKVLGSAAQIASVAIENGYTLSRAMESTRLETENDLLANQTRDMEEMVHVVAHDLRSPMTSLYGFVHVALDELKDLRDNLEREGFTDIATHSELIAEPLRDGIRSVEKLNRMVQRLLEFSRSARGSYSFEKVELNQLAQGVVRSLRYQITKNEIEVDIAPLPSMVGDRVQIEAVFGNLVDNAIKYMGTPDQRCIAIGCRKDGDERVFFVRDTGVGMTADQVGKAFLPFQRFHSDAVPGDGIGLPHVRKIVERHGGRIWCESTVGEGSTFFFTLGKRVAKPARKKGRLARTAERVAANRASA